MYKQTGYYGYRRIPPASEDYSNNRGYCENAKDLVLNHQASSGGIWLLVLSGNRRFH